MSTAAVGEAGEHRPPLGPADAVREQLDPQRPVAEQVVGVGHRHARRAGPHARRVLLGEHLGRRHQRALVTALHRRQQRRDRDHGLAGADVALQQPVHRMGRRPGRRSISAIVRSWALVSANGRASWKRRTSAPSIAWLSPRASCSSARLRITSTSCTRSSSSNASRRRAGSFSAHRLREVDRAERVAAPDQAESPADPVRHRVGDASRLTPFERVLDPAGQLPRGELHLLALRVDRHDAPGAIADQVDDRVRHLQPTPVRPRPCRTGRPAVPRCSWRSRHGWLKNTTCMRPVPSPTLAVTIVRRLRSSALGDRPDGDQHERLGTGHRGRSMRASLVRSTQRRGYVVTRSSTVSIPNAESASRLRSPTPAQPADVDVGQLAERDRRPSPAPSHSTPKRYGYSGWPPRCTSTCTPGRWSASHAVDGRRGRGLASTPVITVTSSRSSSTSWSSSAVAAPTSVGRDRRRCRRRARCRSSRPPRSDRPRCWCRAPPACTSPVADRRRRPAVIGARVVRARRLGVVDHERGERLGHRPGRHDAHRLRR